MKQKLQKPVSKFSPKLLILFALPLIGFGVYSLLFSKAATPTAKPPFALGCEAGATNVTTASAVRSEVVAGRNVCVTSNVGDVDLSNIIKSSDVIVSTNNSGSMGAIDLIDSSHIIIRKAKFRSTLIRNSNFITIEKSTIGGTSTNRVLDQLIFMPDTNNDVTIQDNEIAWTKADNTGNTGYGCRCYGDNNRLKFQRNWVHDIAADGFQGVGGTDVLIDRNEIGPVGANSDSSEHSDNIQITGNDSNLRITNNWLHHQGYYADQPTGNSGSSYIHGGSTGTLLYENNLVESSLGRTEICGLGTGGTSRSNITIQKNTWIDNGQSFSNFPSFEWDCDSGTGNTITRNIAVDPDGGLAQNGIASAILSPNLFGQLSLVTFDSQKNCTSANCNPSGQEAIGYRCPIGVWWCGTSTTPPPTLPGDVNKDDSVNLADISALLSTYGQVGTNLSADLDNSGSVNIADLSIILQNYGKSSTTTPPTTTTCTGAQHTPGGPDSFGGCWPGTNNTGVPAGTALTAYTGPKIITTANTIIDSKIITSGLDIRAPGVMIKNSKISGVGAGEDIIAVDTTRTSASVTVLDSEIDAGNGPFTGIGDINWTAKRVKIYNGHRGVHCYDNCLLEDSYIADQWAATDGSTHESGARMGQRSTFKHNTLWCNAPDIPPDGGCSADLTGYGDWTTLHDNWIERNLLMATTGGYCAYGGSSASKPYPNAYNIVFKENIFGRHPSPQKPPNSCGYYGTISDFNKNASGNQWLDNKFDNGVVVSP